LFASKADKQFRLSRFDYVIDVPALKQAHLQDRLSVQGLLGCTEHGVGGAKELHEREL